MAETFRLLARQTHHLCHVIWVWCIDFAAKVRAKTLGYEVGYAKLLEDPSAASSSVPGECQQKVLWGHHPVLQQLGLALGKCKYHR